MTKQVDINAYAAEQIKNGSPVMSFIKTARIQARPGKIGEQITTVLANGTIETKNVAKEGDMIATNPGGEQYIIPAETFQKKYEADPTKAGQYRPKGGPQSFIRLTEDVAFRASWGEDMVIKAGGVLNVTNPQAVYGIAGDEFKSTYAPCDKNGHILTINLMSRNGR